jgi:hypothetical protein
LETFGPTTHKKTKIMGDEEEEEEGLNNRIGNNFLHAYHFLLNLTHQLKI